MMEKKTAAEELVMFQKHENRIEANELVEGDMEKERISIVDISLVESSIKNKEGQREYSMDALFDLSCSIKQFGFQEPIFVKRENGHFEILVGERKWRAAKLAGLKKIPVIVCDELD